MALIRISFKFFESSGQVLQVDYLIFFEIARELLKKVSSSITYSQQKQVYPKYGCKFSEVII